MTIPELRLQAMLHVESARQLMEMTPDAGPIDQRESRAILAELRSALSKWQTIDNLIVGQRVPAVGG